MMETFCSLKEFTANPGFSRQRGKAQSRLDYSALDPLVKALVRGLNSLEYCFTLQACQGHFVHQAAPQEHNLAPLPLAPVTGPITYRLAYIALCLDNSPAGRTFLQELTKLSQVDEEYVQVGCADWFWERQVNSFAIQVEPERFKHLDQAQVQYEEALRLQAVRDSLFKELAQLIERASF